jgi:hypothetical protein
MVRVDTGWTNHDLEVLPSTWIRLRLTTVTEELEMGKKHFRCRLASRWSLLARILFAMLALALGLGVCLFARAFPGVWFSIVLLPLLGWYLEDESALHKALLARLITNTDCALKMVRLDS